MSSDELLERINALEFALNERTPNLPVLLKEIHTALHADPENVTLMTEEQINVIVRGLMAQTNTYIATSIVKSTTTKKLKNLSINDI